ncbi:MAG: DUF1501 domain-containing protein [Betaproteobacteria bacterium]|nr:MAG: DUF1501 domain-containing protein [Betaproteobacteria bacterium]
MMNHTRRHLLQGLTASTALASLTRFGVNDALAQAAPNDYKALVCVFLFGGNDGNNMIIGADTAGYAEYAKARSVASGINIAQSELKQFQPRASSRVFGFHPSLTKVHPLFTSGQLAVLANVGPLNSPMTKAQYQANTDRPFQLFSHADQQAQWQSAISDEVARYGIGGRIADVMAASNAGSSMPVITSLAGTHLFNQGAATSPLAVPSSGSFTLTGANATDAVGIARTQALMSLLGQGKEHALVGETADGLSNAISLSGIVNPVITTSNPTVESLFSTTGNSLAQQLQQVAKLIAARGTFGVKRQIFFVSLGGFDTHANQLATQAALLTNLDNALKSFYDATAALGVANNVTTFTMSDFGRTFLPASGGGSDHAWGNHQLIMGGAVKGGSLYGQFPSLAIGGADDVSTEGRWLPTTSVDQYVATLASWFGVPGTQLSQAVPNIDAFGVKNLGFV